MPQKWLVTGAAGFIGSHLVETLLKLNQTVVGLDNFSTGRAQNLDSLIQNVGEEAAKRFQFIQGDIRSLASCHTAMKGVDYLLHQAAVGSVPRSIEDPIRSHESNVDGFLNILVAARDARVKRVVYASSSSVYGDHPDLPKKEGQIGSPLSPYAATKRINEIYADVFHRNYQLPIVGLRYFNVFGARQDPQGPYAAVIPKWITALLQNEAVFINGTGETSRDFTYVMNVVQINLLAATSSNPSVLNQVFNGAASARYTLNELFVLLRELLAHSHPGIAERQPEHREFRKGDIKHSFADVEKARTLLGYEPTHSLREGLLEALPSYLNVSPAPAVLQPEANSSALGIKVQSTRSPTPPPPLKPRTTELPV
jgi:UDP-N-acetylglucosamine 4-epimerase